MCGITAWALSGEKPTPTPAPKKPKKPDKPEKSQKSTGAAPAAPH